MTQTGPRQHPDKTQTILKHIKLLAYDALVEIVSLYDVPVSAVKLLMV